MVQFVRIIDKPLDIRRSLPRLVFVFAIGCAGCTGSPTSPTSPGDPSPGPTPAPKLALTRFLAFGDSLTEGTLSRPVATSVALVIAPQSYPYKLQALLADRYTTQTVSVVNEGKGGELAQAGVGRLPSALAAANPEALLLMEGVNEIGAFGTSGIAKAIVALRAMIGVARAAGVKPIMLTYPPQRPNGSLTGPNPVGFLLNSEIRKLAAEEGVMLVDVESGFHGDLTLLGPDGLHPTEAGYTRLSDIVFAAIRAAFERRD